MTLADHTLGAEEELFAVDRVALAPVACDEEFLEPGRFTRGRIAGEMCDGVVELISPVTENVPAAVASLEALRLEVVRRRPDVALLGTGVHPTLPFGDVRHRSTPHYDLVGSQTRSLLRQSTCCGLHVHVGMPDPEIAIVAFNGMRKWVPLLQALAANSPFWHGQDSGMASCRRALFHSLPRTGLPRAFRDRADYDAAMAELCRVAEVPDGASLWWDARPHHSLGTLEIRALDTQASLRDTAALLALVHCLACHEALTADPEHPPVEVLAEASFRAARDGLDATLSVGGPMVSVRDLARHAIDLSSGYAQRLGCASALANVERMLAEGNGAVRQRRAFAAGGMPAVLDLLRRETATPLEASHTVTEVGVR